MEKEERMKELYMQFQMLNQQMEQVSQHLEMLTQQNAELDISINAISELNTVKPGNEFLAPVADGIFLKGEIKETDKLIVNVGSNTTVERTIPEVITLLEKQKNELGERMKEADAFMQELSKEAMRIYKVVEEKSE
ncbi:prefoldin subunit alpha [Candidatus Woesearchaeota archaeon CG_4_10_14_0_2_um_filter_33_13]|nr:MAG: prefoldin subunit alpha [Candidatus Woesearchaeota archaeon CG_4_10_14_0_2_um_filter_33_13]